MFAQLIRIRTKTFWFVITMSATRAHTIRIIIRIIYAYGSNYFRVAIERPANVARDVSSV